MEQTQGAEVREKGALSRAGDRKGRETRGSRAGEGGRGGETQSRNGKQDDEEREARATGDGRQERRGYSRKERAMARQVLWCGGKGKRERGRKREKERNGSEPGEGK